MEQIALEIEVFEVVRSCFSTLYWTPQKPMFLGCKMLTGLPNSPRNSSCNSIILILTFIIRMIHNIIHNLFINTYYLYLSVIIPQIIHNTIAIHNMVHNPTILVIYFSHTSRLAPKSRQHQDVSGSASQARGSVGSVSLRG